MRLPVLALVCTASLGLGATGALAAASRTVAVRDAKGDVAGPVDLQRVSLSRGGDGRLRFSVTLVAPLSPRDLLADAGPPGAVCLRVWTAPDADPASTRPDRLVCVTARSATALRASVLQQTGSGLPRRTGSASVRATKSARSLIVRVSQSALGRPQRIRFAGESTRPGCDGATCMDTVPDAGATRTFRLR
ncbi:MAG: hypothetical protein M3296_04880 [Actinomycetota bacterium]|nr:hypothetical protein [Actinomycetota bacterium]